MLALALCVDQTYASSRPSTCQALLLLSYREIGIGAMAQAWLYVGMAVRMVRSFCCLFLSMVLMLGFFGLLLFFVVLASPFLHSHSLSLHSPLPLIILLFLLMSRHKTSDYTVQPTSGNAPAPNSSRRRNDRSGNGYGIRA